MERKKSPTVWQDFLEKNFFFLYRSMKGMLLNSSQDFSFEGKIKKKKNVECERRKEKEKKNISH